MAARLFGRPKAVKSQSFILENGFEGGGSILLGFDGFTAVVNYSKVCDSASPSFIIGERGSLTVDRISEPKKALLKMRGGESTELSFEIGDAPDNMFYEINAFCAFVEAGGAENASAVSENTLYIMDAVRGENGICFPSDDL